MRNISVYWRSRSFPPLHRRKHRSNSDDSRHISFLFHIFLFCHSHSDISHSIATSVHAYFVRVPKRATRLIHFSNETFRWKSTGLWQMSGARRSRQFPYPSRHVVRPRKIQPNFIFPRVVRVFATLENGRGRFASSIRSNEHVARDTRVTSNHPCFVFHRRITISHLSAGVREILHGVH